MITCFFSGDLLILYCVLSQEICWSCFLCLRRLANNRFSFSEHLLRMCFVSHLFEVSSDLLIICFVLPGTNTVPPSGVIPCSVNHMLDSILNKEQNLPNRFLFFLSYFLFSSTPSNRYLSTTKIKPLTLFPGCHSSW